MEAQLQIESLYRQLYAAEKLIEELERQRDQARSLVVSLEAELALCKEALRQVTA